MRYLSLTLRSGLLLISSLLSSSLLFSSLLFSIVYLLLSFLLFSSLLNCLSSLLFSYLLFSSLLPSSPPRRDLAICGPRRVGLPTEPRGDRALRLPDTSHGRGNNGVRGATRRRNSNFRGGGTPSSAHGSLKANAAWEKCSLGEIQLASTVPTTAFA